MNESDYREDLAARGYGPAETKQWAAGRFNETHVHDQDLYLFILAGEMTVTLDGKKHLMKPGNSIEVPGGAPHSERVGHGVVFLAAKR